MIWPFRRRRDEDLDAEIRAHVALAARDRHDRGETPDGAQAAARREFGNIGLVKEITREMWGWRAVERLVQDVRYGFRLLRRSPVFSLVAVSSLALGIGANATIFAFVNAVLLNPLPFPESDRLVVLREQPLASSGTVDVHPLNFVEWRTRAHSFEALALIQAPPLNVMGGNGAEQVTRIQTTPDLFRVFGLQPILGRAFSDEDTGPAGNVVILGYGFWQRWFGGDPAVIGRTLPLPRGSLTIVGVAPSGLRIGAIDPEVYTPLPLDPINPGAIGSRSFQCYGRLRHGVGVIAARAEMAAIATTLAHEYPLDKDMGVYLSDLHDDLAHDQRPALRLLMVVVAIVLVIACANVAGLFLARGISRRGELAVRSALGASRARLLRQLLIESILLAGLGGATGLLLAYWATRALAAMSTATLGIGMNGPVALDGMCVAFTLVVSTGTVLLFGLAPAWQASRVVPQAALGGLTRGGTADRRHHKMRKVLVVAEISLAVVLLVAAILLLRTFSSLVRVNLGFQPADTITMGLFLGERPAAARVAIVDAILDRVGAVPGVQAAGTIQFLPLTTSCNTGFWFDGQSAGDRSRALSTDCSLVSRGFFAAMGIPVREGRPFDRGDRLDSPRVLLVNQSFAKQYFPGTSAVGRRILVDASNQALAEIVGVVGDVRHHGLTTDPVPTVFLLHEQAPGYIMSLVVRTTRVTAEQAAAVRRAIHDVDPTQAVSGVKTMDGYVGDAVARPRLFAVVVGSFAVLSGLLAAVGMYGLSAFIVTQRKREFGIRLALGATPNDVLLAVCREGLWLLLVGLFIGLTVALGLRGLLSKFLFGVTSGNPASYLVASAAFIAVSVAAIGIPARRAAAVDPNSALRNE